jgi:hypothetical protein
MSGPAEKWQHKGLSVAAWANDRGVSFTIQKRYKDKKTEEWKESKYLFPEDIKALHDLIGQALAWHHRSPMPTVQELVSNVSAAASIPLKQSRFDDEDVPF